MRLKLRLRAKLILLGLALLLLYLFLRTPNPATYALTIPAPEQFRESTSIDLYNESQKIIWLDAGHGGFDVGTYAVINGLRVYEKDITLAIVLKAYELLQESNLVQVFLTRTDDSYVNLANRPTLWNESNADLVVSVHVDFYDGSTAQAVSGIQVNYCQNKAYNTGRINIIDAQFAQIMQNQLISRTGARDRHIRGDREFVIPTDSTMPTVLIEAGFMSNRNELAKLLTPNYQMLIATAIYNGILEAIEFDLPSAV